MTLKMASEKNPEVVGCDASIMKNVWEIREREYAVKLQMEQERIEKSALPTINQDWLNRLLAKQGQGYKRVEKKAKPVENQTDTTNVWKSKPTQVPPAPPRGIGAGQFGRPGGQKRGFSTPATNNNDKKGQDKNFNKQRSLMLLAQTQPSTMVWGKSWKYNKCLPLPEEASATPDWGQCWMFATHQPYTEAGKPWLNGPNMMDPETLHFWRKTDDRVVESQELDLSPADEWRMSWRKSDQRNKKGDTASDGDNLSKFGLLFLLEETQHHNESLCSSEWNESWRSTKPASQQDDLTVPNDGQMNESIANKQDEDREKWQQNWRFINHSGSNNLKLNEIKTSHRDWANSWSAATVVFNNHKNSDRSVRPDHHNTYDDGSQQKELHFHKVMSNEEKYRQRLLQLCNEFKAQSDWSKSWEVTKNNSKPCEEIEKILKETASKVQKNAKGHHSASEKNDPRYEQLRNNVIYYTKREFTQSYLLQMKHMENVSFASEWRDSWKTLKHRMRMERRRMRPDPSRPFKATEKGENITPSASEWKDSRKFTCLPLHQQPEFWQQGWSAMPQIRVDRARVEGHFAPVELPMNGPSTEGSWRESWRSSRGQNRSEPVQGRAQTSKRSDMTSHLPDDSHRRRSAGHTGRAWSGDWQEAWMVSETQFHHDKPSFTQWRESWKCSAFNTEHWAGEGPRENGVYALMEIQPQREKFSMLRGKAKMSRSFDNQIFRERYPEKQWSASWRAGRSSTTPQQHATTNGQGSKWGMSFRLANPMPHVEQPWVKSSPNPSHYRDMWSRKGYTQTNTKFSNNFTAFKLWGNSYQFLHGNSKQNKDKTKSKQPVDPRVIITKKTKTRRHLYTTMEKEKQSDRKWAGCHLLGKTQPRPKRGPGSTKKLIAEDKNTDKFFEEWMESWRYFVRPSSLKKQMPVKSLSGWNESWKFLIPPYQQMNVAKAK